MRPRRWLTRLMGILVLRLFCIDRSRKETQLPLTPGDARPLLPLARALPFALRRRVIGIYFFLLGAVYFDVYERSFLRGLRAAELMGPSADLSALASRCAAHDIATQGFLATAIASPPEEWVKLVDEQSLRKAIRDVSRLRAERGLILACPHIGPTTAVAELLGSSDRQIRSRIVVGRAFVPTIEMSQRLAGWPLRDRYRLIEVPDPMALKYARDGLRSGEVIVVFPDGRAGLLDNRRVVRSKHGVEIASGGLAGLHLLTGAPVAIAVIVRHLDGVWRMHVEPVLTRIELEAPRLFRKDRGQLYAEAAQRIADQVAAIILQYPEQARYWVMVPQV